MRHERKDGSDMERQYKIIMFSKAGFALGHSIVTLESIGKTTKVDDETAIKTLKAAWDDISEEFKKKYLIDGIALYTSGRFSRQVYGLGKSEIDKMSKED